MTLPYLTPNEAKELGYVSLTTPYNVKHRNLDCRKEAQQWLNTIIADLQGTDSVLVDTGRGIEAWRHGSELNTILGMNRRENRGELSI